MNEITLDRSNILYSNAIDYFVVTLDAVNYFLLYYLIIMQLSLKYSVFNYFNCMFITPLSPQLAHPWKIVLCVIHTLFMLQKSPFNFCLLSSWSCLNTVSQKLLGFNNQWIFKLPIGLIIYTYNFPISILVMILDAGLFNKKWIFFDFDSVFYPRTKFKTF